MFFSAEHAFSQGSFISVHQEQSLYYSNYDLKSENLWDSLRYHKDGKAERIEKTTLAFACNLNKKVYGWNPYWMGSAYQNYDWNLISDLCHFSYEVDASTGNASTTHAWMTDAAVTAAKANGVKVSLCATLFSNHATFLGSATAKQAFITNIISMVQQRGGSGCNIDFEGVPLSQSANFTAFMIDLCNQMHAALPGSEISIALPAVDWSAVYNVNAMVGYVDLFIIMGYDYYWNGSTTAGPTDPLYNFDPGYKYTLTKSITYYLNKNVPRAKLLLGLPYYGREYVTTSASIPTAVLTPPNSTTRTFSFVKNNTSGNYINQQWDPLAYVPYFAFNTGNWNQCFINNGYSLGKRLDIVNQFGIGGIGIWALGYDDGYTDFWNRIREKLSDCGTVPCSDTLFDMGGPGRDYFDNENYTYTIAPSGATSLTLAFSAFDVELNFDTLWIYDGPSASSTLIGAYTGTNSPGTINSTGGAITLRWASDNGIQKPGWRAIWNCVLTTGLEQTSNQIKFTAYPNPFSEQITCTLNSPNLSLSEIEVEIYNVLGKRLQQISSNNSSVKIERADMPSGIYFLKINTASGQQIIKIVAD